MNNSRTSFMRRARALFFGLLAAAGLGGCGGGGGDDGFTGSGEVVIGLTDAAGDFVNYTVDVEALTLTRANGAVVDVLPLSTRVDFAQYTELTEFFTAATVPLGNYTKATLTLDYSDAEIYVEDAGGSPVKVTTITDSNGTAITGTYTVEVQLEDGHPLVVAPGVPAHVTLDFDLAASHTVDITTDPANPSISVNPILLADVQLEAPKEHRLRGLLGGVDTSNDLITVNLRPFHHRGGGDHRFGTLQAYVNDGTLYEIDGASHTGSGGLAALDSLALNSWIVVYGALNTTTKHFEASEVYAGSSVPGSDQDWLSGAVLARSGDVLTVNAGTIVTTTGTLIFNKNVTITLDAATPVTRQLSTDPFDKDDISVGQRIVVLGTFDDSTDTMTPERVRMELSQLSGEVVSTASGELVLDVQHFNGRRFTAYDFSGTGTSSATDADPKNYQIATGTLDLSGMNPGDPVRVRGFVTPFGTTDGSTVLDFEATTVIELARVNATLLARWFPASDTAVTSASGAGIVLNLAGTVVHHVLRNGVVTDLGTSATPSIVPTTDGNGLYAIRRGGTVYVYTTFGAYIEALNARLAASDKVVRFDARGPYDDGSVTLTANAASIALR